MYKAVIFDLDNTLMDYTQSELDCMIHTCRALSLFHTNWERDWEPFRVRYLGYNFRYFVHGEALNSIRSLADDYNGALQAGIDFCYYNRSGAVLPENMKPKYAIRRLKELAESL